MTPELREKLAGRRVVASVSGGKDSAALSLWLTEQGIDHDRVFMDTGWEHPATYEYLRGPLTEKLGPITEIRGKRTMQELVRHKGSFPGRTMRFCTQELKVFPLRDYLRKKLDAGEDICNAVGIRAAESAARAKMPEWEWQDEWDCEVWRPLIRWTEAEVIAIHTNHGLRPNPLYLQGASRVGCWPCIFARKEEISLIAKISPERITEIRDLERDVQAAAAARYARHGEDFKSLGYAEPTFFMLRPNGVKHQMAPIDEVVTWARTSRGGKQLQLIEPPAEGCMRWGLCDTAGEKP